VDTAIHERLINARDRLRLAVGNSLVPDWLVQTAQQCLIDLDCALSDGLSGSQMRMLLAQVDALVSAVDDPGRPPNGRDAGSR
jgi:hypothetical protein